MSEPSEVRAALTDDEILAYTQGIRKSVADQMVSEGPPNDPKVIGALMNVLTGMDIQAIQKKRIASETEGREEDRRVIETAAAIMAQFSGMDPFRKETDVIEGRAERLDPQLPIPELPPGATEVGIIEDNFDNFVERYRRENPTEEDGESL